MAARKSQTYICKPREDRVDGLDVAPRLIRGTLGEVERFILDELSIEVATVDQAVELGASGVKIEEATGEDPST